MTAATQPNVQSLNLDIALAYIAAGIPVFPCRVFEEERLGRVLSPKSPLTQNGFNDATLNERLVTEWWRRNPEALVGIPTGTKTGFFAVDVDIKEGKGGDVNLAKLEAEHGKLPATVVVQTATGGFHYLFKHVDGLTNSTGRLPEHIDIRAEGGFVIAAGSTFPDGTFYEFIDSQTTPADFLGSISDAPGWLIDTIKAPRYKPRQDVPVSANDNRPAEAAEIEELLSFISPEIGYQDWVSVLMAVHSALGDAGLAIADAWSAGSSKYKKGDVVTRWRGFTAGKGVSTSTLAVLARDGGADLSEIARKHRGQRGDGTQLANPDKIAALVTRQLARKAAPPAAVASEPSMPANDNKRDLPDTPAMHADPYNPGAVGGLIADVAKWITKTAVIPVDELSLMSAVALMAGVFGSRALTPTRSGVNIYATTIVRTAGGKGRPPKAIRALADKALPGGIVSNGDPTSFAAFERILRRNSSVVTVLDEFGIMLQGVNSKRHDPAAASIRKLLLIVYDLADGTFDGKAYASADAKKDDSPIDGPALTVLSMTTAETLAAGMSEESVSDGFMNRFIFVESQPHSADIRPPDLTADTAPPAALVHDLQKAVETFPAKVVMPGKSAKAKFRVPFDGGLGSDAHKAWNEVFLWQHAKAWTPTESMLRGRAAENTIRLATLRAISRNPWRPVVTVDDIRWGWTLVFRSISAMDGIAARMVGSKQEECRNSIVAALQKAKGVIYRSRLMRLADIKRHQMQDFTAAMAWLYASGAVMDISEEKDGSKLMLISQETDN
ncbi:bifunctional DNA primase/polymerase [Rhizobium mesoamericanum]|uniref:bifunctional DNA primase/polymerase n=1 Tax=Rhizobium mesoamericanum TaxID=1079800 RepID=UPI00041FB639|nr:bifunctional DNA primase/polymerase [Rhizobium mesoamericanum]